MPSFAMVTGERGDDRRLPVRVMIDGREESSGRSEGMENLQRKVQGLMERGYRVTGHTDNGQTVMVSLAKD